MSRVIWEDRFLTLGGIGRSPDSNIQIASIYKMSIRVGLAIIFTIYMFGFGEVIIESSGHPVL